MAISFRFINDVLDQSSLATENRNREDNNENSAFENTLEKCAVIMTRWFQEHFTINPASFSKEEVHLVACSVDVIMGPFFNTSNPNPYDLDERIPRFMRLNFGSVDNSKAYKEKIRLRKAKFDSRFSGLGLPEPRVAELFAHFSLQSNYITCKKYVEIENRCLEGTTYLIAVGKYLDSRGDGMTLPQYSNHFRKNIEPKPIFKNHDWKKYEVIKSCMGLLTNQFQLSKDQRADYLNRLYDHLTTKNQIIDFERVRYIDTPRFKKVIKQINKFSTFSLEDGFDKYRFFFGRKTVLGESKTHRLVCSSIVMLGEDLWQSMVVREPFEGENRGKHVVLRKTYQAFSDQPPLSHKKVEVFEKHKKVVLNTRYSTGPLPKEPIPKPNTQPNHTSTAYSTGPFPKESIPQPKRSSKRPDTSYSTGPFPKESIPRPKSHPDRPGTPYSTGPLPKEFISPSHRKRPSQASQSSGPQPKERVRPMPKGKSQSPPSSKNVPKSPSYPSYQPKKESFARRSAAAQPKNPSTPSQRDRVLAFFALNSDNLRIFREQIITPASTLIDAMKSNDAFINLGPEGRKQQAETMIKGITELAKTLRLRNMRALQAAFHVDRLKLEVGDARATFFHDLFIAISTHLQDLVNSNDIRDITEFPTWSL